MSELNLFDGLSAALDWLAPVSGKKAVVLLATGLETASPGRWDSLVEKLRSSDVAVFAVGLGGELRPVEKERKRGSVEEPAGEAPTGSVQAPLSFERAERVLEELAQLSGGHAYFPRDGRSFATIYRQIATALRNQYSLGFPPAARDARFHKIAVEVVDARGRSLAPTAGASGYRIHARPGYLAPAR
jgi:VWFA-related protein